MSRPVKGTTKRVVVAQGAVCSNTNKHRQRYRRKTKRLSPKQQLHKWNEDENIVCTKCQGEWSVCPNNNCTNVLKWNEDDNVVCTVCQLNNRSDRKAGKEKIRWRWHRCGAKNCKAMYVFNRGRRLKRSADKCGLLQMKKKYHKP